MHPHQPIRLRHILHIIRYLIPNIQSPILVRLLPNPQQLIHLRLLHPRRLLRQLRQPLIRLIPCLIHHLYIEILLLPLKQHLTKLPKLARRNLQDCRARLVYQRT